MCGKRQLTITKSFVRCIFKRRFWKGYIPRIIKALNVDYRNEREFYKWHSLRCVKDTDFLEKDTRWISRSSDNVSGMIFINFKVVRNSTLLLSRNSWHQCISCSNTVTSWSVPCVRVQDLRPILFHHLIQLGKQAKLQNVSSTHQRKRERAFRFTYLSSCRSPCWNCGLVHCLSWCSCHWPEWKNLFNSPKVTQYLHESPQDTLHWLSVYRESRGCRRRFCNRKRLSS